MCLGRRDFSVQREVISVNDSAAKIGPKPITVVNDRYADLFEACRKFAVVHGLIRKHDKFNTGIRQRNLIEQVVGIITDRQLTDKISSEVVSSRQKLHEAMSAL